MSENNHTRRPRRGFGGGGGRKQIYSFNSPRRSDRAAVGGRRYNGGPMPLPRRWPLPQLSRPLTVAAIAALLMPAPGATPAAPAAPAAPKTPAVPAPIHTPANPPAAAPVTAPAEASPAAARRGPETRPADDVLRLFRFHAAAQAAALRDAVERARFDETRRDELRLLVREHLRRVDDEVARVTAAMPLDDVLAQAADLARDFSDRQVGTWLDEHPAVYQPVQEQIALAEAYERSVAEEPDAVLRSARAAGLPAEREANLRRLVTDAHERLRAADSADERRLREAEAKAAASAPPAQTADTPAPPIPPAPPQQPVGSGSGPGSSPRPGPGPGPSQRALSPAAPDEPSANAPSADARERATVPERAIAPERSAAPDRGNAPERADALEPTAAPAPAAPRPPSPEEEKLQLLDALLFMDAQARVAAAAREVRAEVEKLLNHPPQRKALDDEMLRWYQTYAPPPPPEESEEQPPASEGPVPQRPAQGGTQRSLPGATRHGETQRAPARFDPGF